MSDKNRWLDALTDGSAGLKTLPTCMTICDLKNDNYYKLIAAEIPMSFDLKPKLKVYKGAQLINEQGLPGIPSGVETLYIDESEPKNPIIAVSVGASILFYRNLKPYFKYTLPSLDVHPAEKEVWTKLPLEKPANNETSIATLKKLDFSQLTSISQKIIFLPENERESFIQENADAKLEKLPIIVAITTIKKHLLEEKSPTCLVLASENSDIIILDVQTFSILHKAKVCSFDACPDLISASGSYSDDYKIVVATRSGSICLLRKNWLEGREIVKLEYPATGLSLLPIDQTIVVVCMNSSLMCYSKKGKILWSSSLPENAVCMTPMSLPHMGITLICVGLKGGLVQLYHQKNLVDQFYAPDTVSAMKFGQFGQEEHVLILITNDGSLIIKILRRTAEFLLDPEDEKAFKNETPAALSIPKKTKIFIEQTVRERENSGAIHHIFQSELWRMRLTAAKTTLDIVRSSDSTFSGDVGQAALKLLAEVVGLGPDFVLYLTLENISATMIAKNLAILLHADPALYTIKKRYVELTPIVPGCPLKMDFDVSIPIDAEGMLPDLTSENSIIRVMVIKDGLSKPLIASTVVMPAPEIFD